MEYIIETNELREFCASILKKIGQKPNNAEIISDSLIEAELRGVSSHGIIRFPFYVKRMVVGGTKINPEISKVKENLSTALLDGDNGMGQIAATEAMKKAIKKAKKTGIGFVTINNSCHFGAGAYYSMQALKDNMIGIVWSNVTNVMAPWGGKSRVIGNNPLSIAIPAGEYDPIVLDMSMSKVSGGKVRVAAKNGEEIPLDWIINKEGKSTNNPNDLPDGGALMATGYKGYGLAIVGEVLSGVLSGAGLLANIPVWFKHLEKPTNIGHMTMAIDINSFIDIEDFKEKVDYIIKELKSSSKAEDYQEILVPGEPEFREKRLREEKGNIELSGEILNDLDELAQKHDINKLSREQIK